MSLATEDMPETRLHFCHFPAVFRIERRERRENFLKKIFSKKGGGRGWVKSPEYPAYVDGLGPIPGWASSI